MSELCDGLRPLLVRKGVRVNVQVIPEHGVQVSHRIGLRAPVGQL